MFYALVSETRNEFVWHAKEIYAFNSRKERNEFVRLLNEDADAHRRYRGWDVWPVMWTKYDKAESVTAVEAHKLIKNKFPLRWHTDGDRWTYYMPADLFTAN